MTDLLVAPCSAKAARFAVERWHYSGVLPVGKVVRYGVWEDGSFVGAVLYGRGGSPYLLDAYGLDATEGCELVRVALRDHVSPVSEIVARSLALLRRSNPGLRIVVSFADPVQGHHGGIYQAGNWLYLGTSGETLELFYDGRWQHVRSAYYDARDTWRHVPTRVAPGKHRYAYPLDRAMRRQLRPLVRPYPSAEKVSTGDAPLTSGEGRVRSPGSAPTEAVPA